MATGDTTKTEFPADLTGVRFGRLTAIEPTEAGRRDVRWRCRCDCGGERVVRRFSLTCGKTKSCGCLRREKSAAFGRSKAHDLTGRRFGRMTVLSRVDGERESGHAVWECRCDCGTVKRLATAWLRPGKAVSCGCRRADYLNGVRFFTPEKDALVRELYPTLGRDEVARRLGCSPAVVTAHAKRLGVRSLVWHKLHGMTQRAANRSVRLDFFDHWTPEMAYTLGYIWADGCAGIVRGDPANLRFACVEDDREILDGIAAAMGYAGEIRHTPAKVFTSRNPRHAGRRYTSRPQVRFAVHSRHVVERLMSVHGVMPRKTFLDPPFPANVPDDMLGHFARGNLDGDGTVYAPRPGGGRHGLVAWLGTPRFVAGLAGGIAKGAGVSPNVPRRTGRYTAKVNWAAQADFPRLRDWLYRDATLFLSRKRKKLDALADAAQMKAGRSNPAGLGECVVPG